MNKKRKSKPFAQILGLEIRVSVGAGILSFIVSILTIYLFVSKTFDTEVMKFALTVISVAAGLTSVFYVGENLRISTEEKKLERAKQCIMDWNNPGLANIRKSLRQIREAIKGQEPEQHQKTIDDKLATELDLEQDIVTILNFLDGMAILVEYDLVDEDMVYDYFSVIVSRICDVFHLWISKERKARDENLYKALTDMNDKWKEDRKSGRKN